jgi:hypothetical protein
MIYIHAPSLRRHRAPRQRKHTARIYNYSPTGSQSLQNTSLRATSATEVLINEYPEVTGSFKPSSPCHARGFGPYLDPELTTTQQQESNLAALDSEFGTMFQSRSHDLASIKGIEYKVQPSYEEITSRQSQV